MMVAFRRLQAGRGPFIFFVLALLCAMSLAQAEPQSLKDGLIGHWKLVSINVADTTPYGNSPQGSMFFDAAGDYSVIIVTGGDARSVAYFGTYTVNEADSIVTMHINAGTRANAAGRDEKRLATLNGDQLVLQRQPASGPAAALGTLKSTWQRGD